MRARGIAGRHERREPGREDEDPLVAIDYGYLKLDGREDDDGDEDDGEAQNKLLILVAKDVKTGAYAATCLREKGFSQYPTSWMVSLLRRLEHCRAILQSDAEPSVGALKTATSLVESAMREVNKQTRALKFALEAHVGKIVESHSILSWMPMMASDAISFFRIGRDSLTAEVRRSGRAWKKLVAEFEESVYYRPAVARTVASGMQPKTVCWTVSWTPRTNRQHSHHDDRRES